jgi:hypothetical protein
MKDISLFEDFKEGKRGRRRGRSSGPKCDDNCQKLNKLIVTQDETNATIKEIDKDVAATNATIKEIDEEVDDVVSDQAVTNKSLSKNIETTLNNQANLASTLPTDATGTTTAATGTFTTREGLTEKMTDTDTGNKLINYNKDTNTVYYLKSIQNQNKSLNDNINYLSGNFSSDNQKFLYQQQYILYWTAANFWMFYIYMVLAVVYGLIFFIYKEGGLGGKIFWYLLVFFYPYLAIYCEIALFLFFMYVYCWVVGQPFTVWRYFTSYPSIV